MIVHSKIAERKLQTYLVGPYEISIRRLFRTPYESYYMVRPSIRPTLEQVVRRIESEVGAYRSLDKPKEIPRLQQLIDSRLALALSQAEKEIEDKDEAMAVAQLATFRSLRLEKIISLLMDDRVEEIFLDGPNEEVYLDHKTWGRCKTNIKLSSEDVSAIKTRISGESGLSLDFTTPSLKAEVLTRSFHARFSIDIAPLAYNGLHMDVRKLRLQRFTLPELIANGTITAEACAYLYYCLTRRRNICVVGEPNSGKTTLINALDILTPQHWRKLTIEDVIESIGQLPWGFHQARFKVVPIESTKIGTEKGREVVKLLHRAPDFIYLGEVQTAEHSRAMFHALACGLKGLETCHALSPEQVIRRWVLHHKVPMMCMYDLDLIVCMKRMMTYGHQKRRVVRVSEVEDPSSKKRLSFNEDSLAIRDIFAWDPKSQSLRCDYDDLYDSPVLWRIREIESTPIDRFAEEYLTYVAVFKLLSERRIFSVGKNVEVFRFINSERARQESWGRFPWFRIISKVKRAT